MASDSLLDIKTILDEYSSDIQEAITEETEKIAKKGKDELKNKSPKRTGSYRRGWRVKKEKGFGFVECIIHNATDYQLTHLLEKPHLKRNGGITTPKVHIKPVEEKCIREYQKNIENIIKNGG